MHEFKLKAAEWNVSLDEIRETATSLIGFGTRQDLRVVLKITKPVGDESDSGELLKGFEYEKGAVLIERLEPGEPLVNLVKRGDDDEATKILADVIAKLANHEAPGACPEPHLRFCASLWQITRRVVWGIRSRGWQERWWGCVRGRRL